MGKLGKEQHHQTAQPTQADVDLAGKPHDPLPPIESSRLIPVGLLGSGVRALVGGRVRTVILTEYDESSESYWGVALQANPNESSDAVPKLTAVSGLRPYPYTERPNYAFQFVKPGQDESVLINIAAANMPQARGN